MSLKISSRGHVTWPAHGFELHPGENTFEQYQTLEDLPEALYPAVKRLTDTGLARLHPPDPATEAESDTSDHGLTAEERQANIDANPYELGSADSEAWLYAARQGATAEQCAEFVAEHRESEDPGEPEANIDANPGAAEAPAARAGGRKRASAGEPPKG